MLSSFAIKSLQLDTLGLKISFYKERLHPPNVLYIFIYFFLGVQEYHGKAPMCKKRWLVDQRSHNCTHFFSNHNVVYQFESNENHDMSFSILKCLGKYHVYTECKIHQNICCNV